MIFHSKKLITLFTIIAFTQVFSQTNVKINFNVKHTVGGIDTFERAKFITIHADQTENEWNGDNFTPDLLNDFINGYDVYMGRNSGGITWNLNQVKENPAKPGYADPADITSKGTISRNNFAAKTALHQYNNKNNLIVVAQLHPFWTGAEQKATNQGWKLANATATGDYMGRYLNAFHGGNGQKMPALVEIINEPDYDLLGGKSEYTNSIKEIADFHNDVADAIHQHVPGLKLAGYTNSFPDFETGDFQRWINRDKMFMDIAGEKMDFFSIHLYDFPSISGGKKDLRSGSNIEATFDMMEQYSQMKFNKVKPFVISEFGAQMHDQSNQQWSPYRDWLHIKACNSQLMSFMERPNLIESAINFIICKAEWGYSNGIPYNHRLMRKENEPSSYTGQWVYTDMVKFYQLWKNVKGTRIDTKSDNIDIQVDAYVNSNKVYFILNNLNFTETAINLASFESKNNKITAIVQNHLSLVNNIPELSEKTIPNNTSTVTLGAEATMILEYTFENPIEIDETMAETKYYATEILKPIVANESINFNINNIQKNTFGEAVLRIGIGRDHGKSLQPEIKINNKLISTPTNYRGYDQAQRTRFFGVLEIPVSLNDLQQNNTVSIKFSDNSGHVSSVSLQVFNFSSDIRNVNPSSLPANNYTIKTTSASCPNTDNAKIEISALVEKNYKVAITGPSYSKNDTFTNLLSLKDLKSGNYIVKITLDEDPTYAAQYNLELTEPPSLKVSAKVDESSNKVTLQMSGSDTYIITHNNIHSETSAKELTLQLQKGTNTISVKTKETCQGEFNKTILNSDEFSFYPNPASKNIVVSINENQIGTKLFIYSINGMLIKEEVLSSNQNNISINHLSQGVYLLKLSNNTSTVKKLIIQ